MDPVPVLGDRSRSSPGTATGVVATSGVDKAWNGGGQPWKDLEDSRTSWNGSPDSSKAKWRSEDSGMISSVARIDFLDGCNHGHWFVKHDNACTADILRTRVVSNAAGMRVFEGTPQRVFPPKRCGA